MDTNQDEPQVLETAAPENEAPATLEETPDERIERLEKEKAELEAKNKQLYARVKKTDEKPVTEPSQPITQLTPKDSLLLAKADVAFEDVDDVIEFANFRKIPIAEALQNPTLKAILKDKSEERKTAQATQTKSARSANRVTDADYLDNASKGQLPDSDEGIEKLAAARLASKLKK